MHLCLPTVQNLGSATVNYYYFNLFLTGYKSISKKGWSWPNNTLETLKNRCQCFEKQYSSLQDKEKKIAVIVNIPSDFEVKIIFFLIF